MPIKKCALNGKTLRSLDDLYDQLSNELSLPKRFGRNLDALWDVLSTDVPGPFEIDWKHANESKIMMDKDFDRVLKLLQELEKERGDFTLTLEP
jgi:ribonuclease inhibitor